MAGQAPRLADAAEEWPSLDTSERQLKLVALGKASKRDVDAAQESISGLLEQACKDPDAGVRLMTDALRSLLKEGGGPSWEAATEQLSNVLRLYEARRGEGGAGGPAVCGCEGTFASAEWSVLQGFSLDDAAAAAPAGAVPSDKLPFSVRASVQESLAASYALPASARPKTPPPLPVVGGAASAPAGPSASARAEPEPVSIALPKSSRAVNQMGRSVKRNGMGIVERSPRLKMMELSESDALLKARMPVKKEVKRRKTADNEPDPFAGAVQPRPDGTVVYYQDRRKQWPFQTTALGHAMLNKLVAVATPLLRKALAALADEADGAELRREGERIYAQKPNMRSDGITWSQDNYAHLGLQAEYMRLKSIQRFTEGTAAMERAFNAGAFRSQLDAPPGSKQPFRVASLGGGPGFELVAVREFCATHLPSVQPELLSLDLQGAWKPCAEALGLPFGVWDVMDGDGLLAATGGWPSIDLAVISYVYYHYMSNEHCAEWLARLLASGAISAVLIISRFEDLSPNIDAIVRHGVRAIPLIRQPRMSKRPTDHRQLLYVPGNRPPPAPMPPKQRLPCTFPNVPHDDSKADADKSFRQVPGGVFEYTNEYAPPPPPPPPTRPPPDAMFAPPPVHRLASPSPPPESYAPPSPQPVSFGMPSPTPESFAQPSPEPESFAASPKPVSFAPADNFSFESFDQPAPTGAAYGEAYAASSDEDSAPPPRVAPAAAAAPIQSEAAGGAVLGIGAASVRAADGATTGMGAAGAGRISGGTADAFGPDDLFSDSDPNYAAATALPVWAPPGHLKGELIMRRRSAEERAAVAAELEAEGVLGQAPPAKRAKAEERPAAAQPQRKMACNFVRATENGSANGEGGGGWGNGAAGGGGVGRGCSAPCGGALGGGASSADAAAGGIGMSTAAQHMMRKTGWTDGAGLGVSEQGIARAIQEQGNLGLFGLGFRAAGVTDDEAPVAEPLGPEELAVLPAVEWLDTGGMPEPTLDEMRGWVEEGPRRASIDAEEEHVDPSVLRGMLAAKTALDALTDRRAFDDARTRANPFEGIKKEFFMNRAALKMAAIDAALDGLFSCADVASPAAAYEETVRWHYRAAAEGARQEHGPPKAPRPPKPAPGLLFFGDVAAGPGGFSEYVLWRRGGSAKGFGFTLRGDHDFTPGRFYGAAPPELFHPYYGPNNDGDLYSSTNLRALRQLVLRQSGGDGLHMMMADGGFDVSGKENIQELMNKQLLLGQVAAAAGTLREGGHFVCKAFDLFTPFSAGLLYLMAAHFSAVSIYKPAQSRPANSERYVLCRGLRGGGAGVRLFEHLLHVNDRINELKPSWGASSLDTTGSDVLVLVPREVIYSSPVGPYLRASNDRVGVLQRRALRRLVAYMREKGSRSCDQSATRDECLAAWRLPDAPPPPPRRDSPEEAYALDVECGEQMPRLIEPLTLMTAVMRPPTEPKSLFANPNDWVVMPAASDAPPVLIFGADVAKSRGVAFVSVPHQGWLPVTGVRLPRATLLVAEKVTERVGASLRDAVHVYDAAVIAGDDVRKLPYAERRRRLGLLVGALELDAEVLRQSAGGQGGVGFGGGRGFGGGGGFGGGFGGYEDEQSAGDAAVAQHMPVRLKRAYALWEMPRAIEEAREMEAVGGGGVCWPFRGMLLFPGHGLPSLPAPGREWTRHTSKTTGQDYWACANQPSIPVERKPISFRSCLQALMRWDPKACDVTLEMLRDFGGKAVRR
jgi:cap1 methyltransferase